MKIKYRKILCYILLSGLLVLGLVYQLYVNNIYTVRNILMTGLLINLSPDSQLKSIKPLVNLKFHISKDKIKKLQSVFKFYNSQKQQIFEVKIYQSPEDRAIYHYQINNKFLAKKRTTDSFMKMFCQSWTQQCGITFAFSKDEPIANLPEDIKKITLDDNDIDFSTVLYDYSKKDMREEIANTASHLKYEYDNDHIKVCTQFDKIKYTEALRITTLNNNQTQQKVCTKEDTNGMCCEIKGNINDFSNVSVLHWKGSWNEGKFTEYGIDLK
jgi:hypothetical protein